MSDTDPITIWAPDRIIQTTFERLQDLLRAGAIAYKREHDPTWRDKPWMDGVRVDMDETDVTEFIARFIVERADPNQVATE